MKIPSKLLFLALAAAGPAGCERPNLCGAEYGGGGTVTITVTPTDDDPIVSAWSGVVAGLAGDQLDGGAFAADPGAGGAALRHAVEGRRTLIARLPAAPPLTIEGGPTLTWLTARLAWNEDHTGTEMTVNLYEEPPVGVPAPTCTIEKDWTDGTFGSGILDEGWSGTVAVTSHLVCPTTPVDGRPMNVTLDFAYDLDADTYVDNVKACGG